jgi:hypothetical protein
MNCATFKEILAPFSNRNIFIPPSRGQAAPKPTKKLRAESGAGARRRHLLGLTIPAYETHCWKW